MKDRWIGSAFPTDRSSNPKLSLTSGDESSDVSDLLERYGVPCEGFGD